jgi:dCMP deaminase
VRDKLKKKFIDHFMRLAESTAELSSARRLKVGSILVRDDQVLSTGYNGTPSGWDNNCEDETIDENGVVALVTKPEVLHSEANCLMKIAKSTMSSKDSIMFCTHEPCLQCAKLIYQGGIKKLYYRESYRDHSGIEFLYRGGIEVERYVSE